MQRPSCRPGCLPARAGWQALQHPLAPCCLLLSSLPGMRNSEQRTYCMHGQGVWSIEGPAVSRREGIVAIDVVVGRFSEPAHGGVAPDCARITPLDRWDVDAVSPAISHRPGSRFGRHAQGFSMFSRFPS